MRMRLRRRRRLLKRYQSKARRNQKKQVVKIRAENFKRIQEIEAAKKAVKEFLICTGAAIAMSAGLFYAFLSDPYEPPKPEPRMIKAIQGDYYYPEDSYDQYLEEREEYLKEEENESCTMQGRYSTDTN